MGTPDQRRAVSVPESTWLKAKTIAAARGVSISAIVSAAIERFAAEVADEVGRRLKT
jgi:hypothetical protein